MEVLIIDDSEIISDLYTGFFCFRGENVTSVNDREEGLNLLKRNYYDLILVDMIMENKRLMGFLKELKIQNPFVLKKVVVICLYGIDQKLIDEVEKFGIASIQKIPLNMIDLEKSEHFVEK